MRSTSNATVMLCVVTKDFLLPSVLRSGFWKAVIFMCLCVVTLVNFQQISSPNNETSIIIYSLSYHSKSHFYKSLPEKLISGVGQLVAKGMRFSSKDPYLQRVIAWSWEGPPKSTCLDGQRWRGKGCNTHSIYWSLLYSFCLPYTCAQTHTYKHRRHNWQIKRPLLWRKAENNDMTLGEVQRWTWQKKKRKK